MSNSEPSAIVLHGIPCIGGLYINFDSNGANGSREVRRCCRADDDGFEEGRVPQHIRVLCECVGAACIGLGADIPHCADIHE